MICASCETETDQTPCVGCGVDSLLVGKYRLERILGRGAQGTTFLATGPDGICAVKELQLGRAAGGKATELFHREAAVLAQLNHDNIPDLYDHFVDGVGVARSLYVVQQFISGKNLEERLNTHRFTEEEVRRVLGQVAHILDYLHTLSPPVIHRDIKPSNLIVDDDGQIHLIDFGAVRDVMRDSVGGGSTVAGTFGYMAPEQLVGDATPQSDLYALGMTAIRLLTREHPTTLADRLGNMEWRSRANVSGSFAAWIDSLVSVDPADRPHSAHPPGAVTTPVVDVPERTGAVHVTHAAFDPLARFADTVLGVRVTRSTVHIPGSLSAQERRDINDLVRQRLGIGQPLRFERKPDVADATDRYELSATGGIGVASIPSTLHLRLQTRDNATTLRAEQRHIDGWGVLGTAATIPLGFGAATISLLLAQDYTNATNEIIAAIATVVLVGSILCVAALIGGWIYSNYLAWYSRGTTAATLDAIVTQLNGEQPGADEAISQPLPMEPRHPEPTTLDTAGPIRSRDRS